MMRFSLSFLSALALVFPAAAQTAHTITQNPLIIQVGVFTPSGGSAVSTSEPNTDTFDGIVATDGCRVSAQSLDIAFPTWAPDVWQIHGRPVTLGKDQATVQLEWKRLRDNGADVERTTSLLLILPLDELRTLEVSTATPNESCASPRSMMFGARYAHRFPPNMVVRSQRGGDVTGFVAAATTKYNAELWLVHSVPGRPDVTIQTTAKIGSGPSTFSFGPLTVAAPNGNIIVSVSGELAVMGDKTLVFTAKRDGRFEPSSRPPRDRTRPDAAIGNAALTRKLPGPDEVLEFQMPPLHLLEADVPGTFAVRVRIRPAR